MQALYFCLPFREQLLEYYANNKNLGETEENLLTCLADLFTQVKDLLLNCNIISHVNCNYLICYHEVIVSFI